VAIDWIGVLDPPRAIGNLRTEMAGDWYRDPWGWPEYDCLLDGHLDWLLSRARSQEGRKHPARRSEPNRIWRAQHLRGLVVFVRFQRIYSLVQYLLISE
jgi:hypothetical protein